jgi:hypothetical protein
MADFFTGVYNWLPLCHVIHKKIFVVHGGLFSRDGVTLDEIRAVDRNMQPPEAGLMCEMLWSDPQYVTLLCLVTVVTVLLEYALGQHVLLPRLEAQHLHFYWPT